MDVRSGRGAAPWSARGTHCSPGGDRRGRGTRPVRTRRIRNHLPRAAQHVRRDVEAGAVRHRRPVHQAAVLVGRVEVRQMGHRHRHQVAVRQHGALRPAGGAAGVEQPRQRRGIGGARRIRGGACQPAEYASESTVSMGTSVTDISSAPIFGDAKTCETPGVVEDLLHLARMQLVVDRDDHALGRPDGEHQLDDLRAVLAGDGDACAGPDSRSDVASRSARSRSSSHVCSWRSPRYTAPRSPKRLAAWSSRANRFNARPIPRSARSPTGTSSNSSRRRRRSSDR